jgi:DNA replication and repair protein RecF
MTAGALSVVRLRLANFRSYAEAGLEVGPRPVVLVGTNGAGKTNVLDAISLLAPGRGLRGAKMTDHIRRGPTPAEGGPLWAISATVARGGQTYEIGTGLAIGPTGAERRVVRLNGAPAASSADLGEIVQMIWLTPAMDRLFVEGASGRRRFLDRLTLGFDAGHARTAARYESTMRERTRLLKFGPRDPAWLAGLEATMAEAGVALARARAAALARLNAMLAARSEAGAFPAAALTLGGEAEVLIEEWGAAAGERLQARFAAGRIADAEAGRATFGPHLCDLAVRHSAKRVDARACSTGEQKALLISIVLAHAWALAASAPVPILLLDEIAAHLDGARRQALFGEILALGAQAWITGTDATLFDDLAAHADVFTVTDGRFARHGALDGSFGPARIAG